MATVKLIINKKHLKKDGTTPIYLQYCYTSDKRTLIHTSIFISPSEWNFEKTEVRRSAENYVKLNDILKLYKAQTEQIIRLANEKGIKPTPQYVRMEFDRFLKADNKDIITDDNSFYGLFERFCEESKNRIQKDSIKGYYALSNNLKAFEKHIQNPITFNTISKDFYDDLVSFLRNTIVLKNGKVGMDDNTVGKQIKNLKTFLNYAFSKKWIQRFEIDFLKVITEEVDKIFLDEIELTKVYEYDFANSELELARDWLIIGCYTGLRFSDFSRLKKHNFKPDFIQSYQKKLKGSSVLIPYHPYVKAVVEKYDYDIPTIEYNDFNSKLKELGKRLKFDSPISVVHRKQFGTEEKIYKKYELMSTHICRRSFCTNLYLKSVAPQTIMKLSGHKSEKAFMKYIRIDNLMAVMEVQKVWS
ncbi:phage integrase SAM-like domain-containing protein [Emticicia sp. W12TSBA100-4]|uniref:phage integrase SAM-like domain-containing protein n=1 Tax=Emticicia sp. W12TSBA100-4 TaxID=3160965 RepID=UPI0033067A76